MAYSMTTLMSKHVPAAKPSHWFGLLQAVMTCGLLLSPGFAAANQALAQKNACVACHQPAARTVGPSWKEISGRYGAGQGTATQLAASIKSGSSGKWGAMPMPAQAQVSEADAQTLAQWLIDGTK
ncbi:c-type cytochrome [Rhodoferax sp.]|uniref:c-type cytochrome n=1 Tax=Rhodoferax sp. TaxID=50421 RepID=UPI00374DAB26